MPTRAGLVPVFFTDTLAAPVMAGAPTATGIEAGVAVAEQVAPMVEETVAELIEVRPGP